jgi:hypothetical protein
VHKGPSQQSKSAGCEIHSPQSVHVRSSSRTVLHLREAVRIGRVLVDPVGVIDSESVLVVGAGARVPESGIDMILVFNPYGS